MAKRANRYRVTVELLTLASGLAATASPLQLEVDNHDEILGIVRRLQEKNPFNDPQQAAALAVGLKLFSEVMLQNRRHPVFEELLPAFWVFMEKLKK
ncbi:DUF3861 domain-containing protein [Hymenobacter ginsengisoli]|uniref:DUF3861 domain-containing protein n=1 Tax=Hymenobacter ginsengisoli TaxID=1051626 RepID=A0ABP8PU35_9BACT|nr:MULTISPECIES: DUF3861 domain-containing protein [unclassified Hymenobacter]MBO2033751.1 DUF3861 domain-containing protein [Hymenobacter sp. BT559]